MNRARIARELARHVDKATAAAVGLAVPVAILGSPWLALVIAGGVCGLQAWAVHRAHAQREWLAQLVERTEGRETDLKRQLWRLRTRIQFEDPETGLGTVRELETAFNRQLTRCRRWSEPFALALVEVADARRASLRLDTTVTTGVARVLMNMVRSDDSVCRMGHQTFAVVLAGSGIDGARRLIDGARTALGGEAMRGEDGDVFLAALGGAAEWHEDIGSIVEMLNAADRDMSRSMGGLQLEAFERAS